MATIINGVKTPTAQPNENAEVNSLENTSATKKMWGILPEGSNLEFTPIPFKALGKIQRITNKEFSEQIHAAFLAVFHDLKGVIIDYVNNRFYVRFFFEVNTDPLPENKIRSIIDLTTISSKTDNLYDKNAVVQNKLTGKNFSINDETRLLLSDFMYGGAKANRPDNKKWHHPDPVVSHINEIHTPANLYDPLARNTERIMLVVKDFDIHRLAKAIYGNTMIISTDKDRDGNDRNYIANAKYEVRYVRPLPDGTFIMHIEQFDDAAATQFVTKENPNLRYQFGMPLFYSSK